MLTLVITFETVRFDTTKFVAFSRNVLWLERVMIALVVTDIFVVQAADADCDDAVDDTDEEDQTELTGLDDADADEPAEDTELEPMLD